MLLNIAFKQDYIGKVLLMICLNLVLQNFQELLSWDDKMSSLANECRILGYSQTFLHHRGRNPHHYEYWIHSLDNGGIPAKMPKKYVLELICDYLAAAKTYGADPRREYTWWLKQQPHMKIHKKTKSYITEVFYKYSIGLTLKESINGNY